MSIENTISAVAQPPDGAAQETEGWISAERRSSDLYERLKKFRAQVVSVFPDGEFKVEMSDGWFIRCPGLPERLPRGLPSEVGAFFRPECYRQPDEDEIDFLVRIYLPTPTVPTPTDAGLELKVNRDGVGQCMIDIRVPRHRPDRVFILPLHRAEDTQTEAAREAMEAIRMLSTKGGVEGELARIEMAEGIFAFAEREFKKARSPKK